MKEYSPQELLEYNGEGGKPIYIAYEGKVYDVLIEDIGKKGDGVAKLGNYTVFVTGAPKGAELKILVEKVTGNIAYAKPFVE